VLDQDRSVQSGLSLEDLKGGRLPEPVVGDGLGLIARSETVQHLGKPAPFPTTMKPMMARTTDHAFTGDDWIFEPKLDGYRTIAFVRNGQVTLRSRNGKDMTEKMPAIAQELRGLLESEIVIDGEAVALDERGLPSFGLLQHTMGFDRSVSERPPGSVDLVYYPFDLLYVTGMDLRKAPLLERKRLLNEVLLPSDHVREVEYVERDGEAFYEATSRLALVGMVAKRRDGVYDAGSRSRTWLKVKADQARRKTS
jgi:bifunctional non-homologous end joining protein LigD